MNKTLSLKNINIKFSLVVLYLYKVRDKALLEKHTTIKLRETREIRLKSTISAK